MFNNLIIKKMNTKNVKTAMMLTLALAMAAAVFSSCGKDGNEPSDPTKVDEQGLTHNVRDFIPDDILQKIEDLGMPIYGGNTPPDITGRFYAAKVEVVASNIIGEYEGKIYQNEDFIISNQNNGNLTVKLEIIQSSFDDDDSTIKPPPAKQVDFFLGNGQSPILFAMYYLKTT